SWPHTSISAIPAAAGTSARPAEGRSTSRRSPGRSTPSAMTAPFRWSGKTAAWTANTARPRRQGSSRRRWGSSPPGGCLTPPSPKARVSDLGLVDSLLRGDDQLDRRRALFGPCRLGLADGVKRADHRLDPGLRQKEDGPLHLLLGDEHAIQAD